MFKNFSFSSKLIFFFSFFSIVAALGIGSGGYWLIRSSLLRTIDKELEQFTDSTSHLVETTVTVSIRNYLKAIAERNEELLRYYYAQVQDGAMTEAEARERLSELLLQQKIGKTGYTAIMSSAGVLKIHPEQQLVHVDVSSFEFVQTATQKKNGYIEYLWKNPGEDQERAKSAYLAYFEPWDDLVFVSSYKSEFQYLVDVNDFREQVLSVQLGETGYIYIMDSQGNLIIHPSLEGQNMFDSKDAQGKYFIREICDAKTGQMTYLWKNPSEVRAREKKVYYTYFELMDWIIVGGVYLDELYKPLDDLIKTIVAITAGLFCLVIPCSILLGKTLVKPITHLVSAAESIGKGELDVQICPGHHDEIGHLAKTFQLMLEALKSVLGQVQRAGIQVTSSTTELAATAREQEAIMATQVDSAKKMVKSVEEISSVSERLVETTFEVSGMLQETVSTASSGQEDLSQMQGAMHQMEAASQSISGRLQTINEKAENITQVVTTITQVAEQTNLLSLNAAIEAEKAGEFGRGFTVVAREIRRLADQTAVATLDIEQMVKEMQSAVAAGVMEMDKFMADVRHNAEDVGRISAQLTQIIDRVQALSPHFDDVHQAMGRQSESAQKISMEILQLNEEMQQTRDSVHETYAVIEQLNEAARNLQEEVSRFKFH